MDVFAQPVLILEPEIGWNLGIGVVELPKQTWKLLTVLGEEWIRFGQCAFGPELVLQLGVASILVEPFLLLHLLVEIHLVHTDLRKVADLVPDTVVVVLTECATGHVAAIEVDVALLWDGLLRRRLELQFEVFGLLLLSIEIRVALVWIGSQGRCLGHRLVAVAHVELLVREVGPHSGHVHLLPLAQHDRVIEPFVLDGRVHLLGEQVAAVPALSNQSLTSRDSLVQEGVGSRLLASEIWL